MIFSNFTSPYVRQNLALAWPLALNALLMQSMLMIDVLLVSPLGEVPLAAMGIATTLIAFILGLQMALANGSQLVMSRAVGAGGGQVLARALWGGATLNLLVALPFWLLLTLLADPISAFLTDDAALAAAVVRYLGIAKHLVLVNAVTQVMIALFNALGRTRVPFQGYLLELPLNALLSLGLIHGIGGWAGLGVQGAALGSLLAIGVRLLYLSAKLASEPRVFPWRDRPAQLSAFGRSLGRHGREVFPVAANVAMLQSGVMLYQLLFAQLALNAYVAITLVMPWLRVGTQFITAWAHACAIAVSQAIGAGRLATLRHKVEASIDVAVAISVLASLFFIALSLVIDGIYPEMEAETYQALAAIAPLYVLLPLVRGYNTVHGHALRALGKTTAVFKVNFAGQWLFAIPLCAFVVLGLEASVFWAFAVQPLEEIAKMWPFRKLARRALAEFDDDQARALMYD